MSRNPRVSGLRNEKQSFKEFFHDGAESDSGSSNFDGWGGSSDSGSGGGSGSVDWGGFTTTVTPRSGAPSSSAVRPPPPPPPPPPVPQSSYNGSNGSGSSDGAFNLNQYMGPPNLQNLGGLFANNRQNEPVVRFSSPRSLSSGGSGSGTGGSVGSSGGSGKLSFSHSNMRHQPKNSEAEIAHKIKEAFAILIQGVEMTHFDAKSLVGDKRSKKVLWLVSMLLSFLF